MRNWVNKVHFVGIGGAGMGGIAEVLITSGYQVSGSDIAANATTRRLQSLGAEIHLGHDESLIQGCDAVVFSSAIAQNNPELVAARQARIPLVPRAEMLAELSRLKTSIAVAGTHGKTTTTSLIASALAAAGLDPTFVIGGLLNSAGSHAGLGQGEYIVVEADESDASFLYLQPTIAVVTNIDRDHMSTYDGDEKKLHAAFLQFLHQVPFYGLAVLCIDDPGVQQILPAMTKPVLTYGFSEKAEIRALDFGQTGMQTHCKVHRNGEFWLDLKLNLPGQHNVLNALAAIAVATEAGASGEQIVSALQNFAGIGRRFQSYGEIDVAAGRALLFDDYAHHPRELEAVFKAFRAGWPERRLVVIFQPHRYTRTQDLFEDFVRVLAEVDLLLLLDVYPAGEEPIAGADGRSLCGAIRQRGGVNPVFAESAEEVKTLLKGQLKDRDLVLTCGAGSIGGLARTLVNQPDTEATAC